jgi:hypothetical protein
MRIEVGGASVGVGASPAGLCVGDALSAFGAATASGVVVAAQRAYDAIGVEHAPQREGTPTEKATVERGFGTIKNALAPILTLLDHVAAAVPPPSLQQPQLARHVATLLIATFLRVYAAGRRHLGHVGRALVGDELRAREPDGGFGDDALDELGGLALVDLERIEAA